MNVGTTETGYKNKHGQTVMGKSDLDSNHHNAGLYEMRCDHCNALYNANGCDIHIRRCPTCQGGKPSSEAV